MHSQPCPRFASALDSRHVPVCSFWSHKLPVWATEMTAALQAPGELGWVMCGLTTPHTTADRIPGRRSQPVLHGPARCRMGSRRRRWLAAISLALGQSAVTPDTRPAVLVTGANRGIGLEIARGVGALGHRVVLASRDSKEGARAEHELRESGIAATFHVLDLASTSSIDALIAACGAGILPAPSILINNGAECLQGASRDVLQRSIAVNYYGARLLTQGLLPLMFSSRLGWAEHWAEYCVVNVSSGDGEEAMLCSGLQRLISGVRTQEHLDALAQGLADGTLLRGQELAFGPTPAYSVSKALLNVYSRILAGSLAEDGAGCRVIAVCPGDVSTRMCSDWQSPILQTPGEAAQDVIWAALNAEECPSGLFFRHRQPISW